MRGRARRRSPRSAPRSGRAASSGRGGVSRPVSRGPGARGRCEPRRSRAGCAVTPPAGWRRARAGRRARPPAARGTRPRCRRARLRCGGAGEQRQLADRHPSGHCGHTAHAAAGQRDGLADHATGDQQQLADRFPGPHEVVAGREEPVLEQALEQREIVGGDPAQHGVVTQTHQCRRGGVAGQPVLKEFERAVQLVEGLCVHRLRELVRRGRQRADPITEAGEQRDRRLVDVTHAPQIEHDELGRGVEHGPRDLLGLGEPEIALQLKRTCSRALALDLRCDRRVALTLGRHLGQRERPPYGRRTAVGSG